MRFSPIVVLSLLSASVSAASNSCTVGSFSGECMSTSACGGSGGKITPGFCPGAKDVQCCTYGSCKTSSATGKCQPTASCTGTSTPGICPGGANIQCCTAGGTTAPPPPPSGGGGASGSSCPPKVNDATVALAKEFEGFVKSPAPDPIGLPTVGYGHLCKTKGCAEVPFKFPLSEAQAAELMQTDMKSFENCLKSTIKVKLTDNQYGALASWAFNVGCGNMESSTLVKRLNKGESPSTVAAEELPKWNKAGGKPLAGLTRRRNAEVALFKKASSVQAIPC